MNFQNEQHAIITLHLVDEIGPRRFLNMVRYFGSALEVFKASEEEISLVEGLSVRLAAKILIAGKSGALEKELLSSTKAGARILTYIDQDYPQVLKNIPDWPPVIYTLGEIKSSDNFSVAIVGTRRPTSYGKSVASKFSREFAASGVCTVSGLASGIDTEVHRSSLEAGGRTIAVLGNGLNHNYPRENKNLQDKIAKKGVLVSEFPMNLPPDKVNFPRRNRIISGLALATVVIEADIKSGALITAKFTLDQGKDVFAVPGPIFSKYSLGPHSLLKAGAYLAESVKDVIDEIKPLEEWLSKKKFVTMDPVEKQKPADKKEAGIIDILEDNLNGMSIDSLSENLKIPCGDLASTLTNLELKGAVRCLPGKIYIINH